MNYPGTHHMRLIHTIILFASLTYSASVFSHGTYSIESKINGNNIFISALQQKHLSLTPDKQLNNAIKQVQLINKNLLLIREELKTEKKKGKGLYDQLLQKQFNYMSQLVELMKKK